MKALKTALLVALVLSLALCLGLALACGDDDDDDNDDDDTMESFSSWYDDDADGEADLQIPESLMAYMDRDFMALLEIEPDCGTYETRCDTPFGLWECALQNEIQIFLGGGCYCSNDCCYCWVSTF